MLYPKINSLWKRQEWYFDESLKKYPIKITANDISDQEVADQFTKILNSKSVAQSFIIGDYAQEEFGLIKQWRVEEKIDGTNIRVVLTKDHASLKGRTENSDMPESLRRWFVDKFLLFQWQVIFDKMPTLDKITLFGEGYGPKIQNGGNYRDDVGFILFDAWAGRWSTREEVKQIAELLQLPTPHDYGIMTEDEIVELVKSKPNSPSAIRQQPLEGVICRSEPLMIANKDSRPVMWKLKCKEF